MCLSQEPGGGNAPVKVTDQPAGNRRAGRLSGRKILGCLVVVLSLGTGCSSEPEQAAPETAQPPPRPDGADAGKTEDPPAKKVPEKATVPWLPLERDGLHDPQNPQMSYLQQPREALSALPPAREGNHVDWAAALRDGHIAPRTNVYPETKLNILDLDVIMPDTAGMPAVRFPHLPHTEWLDCKNCHPKIFVAKRGANPITMLAVLQGEYCGQCHGAVAFPLTQCQRCHSVGTGTAQGKGGQ